MAAPGKPPTSKWGSFLSQAVAGVESRLDNILTETDQGTQRQQRPQQKPQQKSQPPTSQVQTNTNKSTPGPPGPSQSPAAVDSRSPSNNRVNDRLQARLAKAVAGKSAGSSPRSSVDHAGRSSLDSLPAPSEVSESQNYTDDLKAETIDSSEPSSIARDGSDDKVDEEDAPSQSADIAESSIPCISAEAVEPTTIAEVTENIPATEQAELAEPKADTKATSTETKTTEPEAHEEPDITELNEEPVTEPETLDVVAADAQDGDTVGLVKELEQMKLRQQEEIHEYVERIDSLESKLQYLSRSVAESSKHRSSSASAGSTERMLAEKNEKIALLMEEGQKLAVGEQKYRTIIKKLRVQIADAEKQNAALSKDKDKAIADAQSLRSQLSGSAEKEKQQDETRKATAVLQKSIDALKKEKASRDETIIRLGKDLKAKTELADKAESLAKGLASEKEKLKALETVNATILSEKDVAVEKGRQDSVEWKEKLDRAAERGKTVEAELRAELEGMEAKLETMRARAEEVTSGSGGEAQVKLLRQIETLQSQYASASNNWQGMETTLLSKVSNLENERDDAQRRESEMRKKAREATTRARNLEEELQDIQPALAKSQQSLDNLHKEVSSLRSAAKSAQDALDDARADFEKERRSASRDVTPRESEHTEWQEDSPIIASKTTPSPSRPASPLLAVPRTFSSDLMGLGLPLPGRRASGQPPFARLSAAGSHSGSGLSNPLSPFEPPMDTPMSPPAIDREIGLDEPVPSSPRQAAQDMISMSTVAAGPSVQLVERMSAAIRRLEAEKVAAKEEMSRVCSQRDEARADMVGLLKELEDTKANVARVPKLEEEVASLDSRYQTTLELLGEKSELVEELKADVQDVKAMYRELVERTIK